MIRIFGDSISGNCLKVKWTAERLALPFDWVEVDILRSRSRTPEFLAMNPAGQVPAVILDDGRALAQSNAIMLHLALLGDDRYGDSGHAKSCNGCEGEFCRTFHSVSPGSDCDGSNLGARCPTGLSGRRLFCIKLSQAEVLREVCDNLLSAAPPRSARVDIRRQDDDPAAAYSDRR